MIKVQQKHPSSVLLSSKNDPLQEVRAAFRQPLLAAAVAAASNDSSIATGTSTTATTTKQATKNDTIESRYQNGMNRFAFLRMNARQYKPRTYNHTAMSNSNTNGSTTATNGTERFIYKNGKRYPLHSIAQDGTVRNNQRGYVVSPYDGKNLDPQAVTRHRNNLKRAGFINNAHAKGMF
jgi:hypothetical protein